MFLPAGSAKLIKVISQSAVSAMCQCVTSCKDISRSTGLTTYATLETTFDDDPAVTIVATPAEATDREVEKICLYNASSATEVFDVKLYGGTNAALVIFSVSLATTERAIYTPGSGWQCYKATGALKTSV